MSTHSHQGKIIAVDHGLARIGLAISDASQLIARELTIIHRTSKQQDFNQIHALAQQETAIAFVVGIPSTDADDGDTFTQAHKVRNWISYFRPTTQLPIIEWDEQLTSQEAHTLAKRLKRPPQSPVDDLAARIILQSYLDALRDGLATFPPRS